MLRDNLLKDETGAVTERSAAESGTHSFNGGRKNPHVNSVTPTDSMAQTSLGVLKQLQLMVQGTVEKDESVSPSRPGRPDPRGVPPHEAPL